MEETPEAALAYYSNLSKDEKKAIVELFRNMDTDGNGSISISISQYVQYLHSNGWECISDNDIFKEFDKDGDGALDFEEVITFSYMLFTDRFIFCDGCEIFLKEAYFTCSQCFHTAEESYDLCCSCYRLRNFSHHDAVFYDNYALLRSDNLVPRGTITPSPSQSQDKSKKLLKRLNKGVDAFMTGFIGEIGSQAVSNGCNIM